jgi:AcrR family transcriptional regulator
VSTMQGERPLRADAQRNRSKLLAAAVAAFAEHGVDASLEDVARQAGVGIGTLYRHFPNRDCLIESVYRHQVELLCDAAEQLVTAETPDRALALWMERFVEHVATKRGMATALKAVVGKDSELFSYCHGRIRGAVDLLLANAVASGDIRSDVDAADLLKALSGICLVSDQPGWQEQARRLVSLLHDGLRYRGPAASQG